MKVFKFGGASVKDATAVENVGEVLSHFSDESVIVVISAMGKTTNALEGIVDSYFNKKGDAFEKLDKLKDFHAEILGELFPNSKDPIYDEINNIFVEVEWAIEDEPTGSYDFEYDQIVSVGEMLSTKIVSAYLNKLGRSNRWIDVRDLIKTDNNYRDAKVNWEETQEAISSFLEPYVRENVGNVTITQGFVGVTSENFTTTLGREGSDYTAGILGYCLNAEDITIWKDVPGMLNADPKWFDETLKLAHISYKEAIELAYYGATVIHPKTIKPLQNKGITLYVKSFKDINEDGTKIDNNTDSDNLIPSFIFKMNQVLISISANDFSFIVEENLSTIFGIFAKHKIKINLMQNSALNFSISVDNDPYRVPGLLEELQEQFSVLFNDNLELVTIRHYNQATIDRLTYSKEILVEQRSRTTARMVMKNC